MSHDKEEEFDRKDHEKCSSRKYLRQAREVACSALSRWPLLGNSRDRNITYFLSNSEVILMLCAVTFL